jgi:GDP-L-fucose synthase
MIIQDQKVIVTGGAGFLGQHVCAQLRQYGFQQIEVIRKREYDLTEQADVRSLFAERKPRVIIHLAAVVGGIGANRENPGRYFYENAIMGIMLMEEARKFGVTKFVSVGTICSYPKFTPVPFQESHIWNGYPEETNAPYGIAKKALLVQAQAYRQQYDMNAITLLPVNLYGPGDQFDPSVSHVIPALIKKMVDARHQGQPEVTLWGTGTASREFLYVEDAAEGIVLATLHYDRPEPVNLGSGMEITIRELATTIAKLANYHGAIVWDATKPDGQPRRCLDVSRAEASFGFRAKMPFTEGLKRTIAWYEAQRV